MTDRELLEAAARASGLTVRPDVWHDDNGLFVGEGDGDLTLWNPLADDGDALRLAVKLRIAVHYDDPDAVMAGWLRQQHVPFTLDGFGPWFWKEWLRDNENDPCAATRRAIVRAAAEMGK